MSLLLPHNWEHALIANVVEVAKHECSKQYLGRTAIQKMIYFLKVMRVPMRFNFRIHHYGPFCDEIASSLDWLQADHIIKDQATSERYSDFTADTNWAELRQRYDVQLSEHYETICSIVKILAPLEPRNLELIATLDFSYRWIRARGGSGPWKDATITKFKEIKKDRFSDQEIEDCYKVLARTDLIEV